MMTDAATTALPLAHCAQDAHDAEAAHVVGDGTYVTTGEAAALIGISKSTVIKLIRTGQLAATSVPGSTHHRILRTAAEAYREQMAREAAGQ